MLSESSHTNAAAFLALWFCVSCAAAGVCQAAVGDWTTHINSDSLRSVQFDGAHVWCASNGGAVRFDPGSEQFTKTVRSGPGTLVNNDLSCAAVSGGEFTWFGTIGFGLSLLHQGAWTLFTEGITLLPSNDILSLCSSGSSLWAGTGRGLVLFQGSTLEAVYDASSTGGGIPNDVINDILATSDTVWCATEGGVGLGTLSGGTWSWQALNSGLSSLDVLCVGRFGGRVWIGTKDGTSAYSTYEYDGSTWTKMGATVSWTPEALQEMGGILYAAAGSYGVFAWDGSSWLDVTPTFITASFLDLTSDGAGTLWCATSEGLASYDGTDWRQLTPPGPQYDYVEGLSVSSTGTVWAAIRSYPAALRLDDLDWTVVDNTTSGGGFQYATLFSVLASTSGTIWFGHCCHVTCRADRLDYSNGTEVWNNYYFNNSKDITEDASGTIWFSSEGHGIYAFYPSTSSERNIDYTEGKLSSSDVEAVAPVDSRRRWVGHMLNGVDFWDDAGTLDESDDVWRHFSTDDGLPSLSVTSAAIVGNKVYFGTGKGVAVFQDTTWLRNYGASDLVHDGVAVSPTVNDVVADSRGNVWVATAGGIAEISSSGDVMATFTYASSGLVEDEVLCVAADETRGQVWFGTRKGMSVLEAWNPSEGKTLAGAHVYPNPFRPASGHRDVRIDGLPGPVRVWVYDLSGRMLKFLGTVGNGESLWDGTDAGGRKVSTGVYLLRLEASNASSVKKVAVIR